MQPPAKEIYLKAWRQLYRTGELELQFPSYSVAMTARMALYKAIRPYRDGDVIDPELRAAADTCSLILRKGSSTILGSKTLKTVIADAIASQLTLPESGEPVPDPVSEAGDRLLASLTARETPFYTREG